MVKIFGGGSSKGIALQRYVLYNRSWLGNERKRTGRATCTALIVPSEPLTARPSEQVSGVDSWGQGSTRNRILLFKAKLFEEVMIHYLKNKVGVVDFANAQGLVMFWSPRARRARGLWNFTNPRAFVKSIPPTLFLRYRIELIEFKWCFDLEE